ncbi:MAG: glutaredoxin domain-containing protein [Nanoarchaeota archaeon]|nr:glutathione S-transferase N-terminal domain-containing protein [Nanoarchaeota archaeon]MBU1632741.1 glutathione S-transferase N-terminal domain-containing protein [Nanoarchaeota archaeon]MBU1876657.1 glutathione S-transferase N-terminal domain-containing protein [Nanoarchaeota archaeon]
MEIKIYTTPTCLWCEKAKEWFKKKKLKFTELDITEETTYRTEIIEKTGQLSIPVIEIEGNIIVGFDEKEIEEVIEKAKQKK